MCQSSDNTWVPVGQLIDAKPFPPCPQSLTLRVSLSESELACTLAINPRRPHRHTATQTPEPPTNPVTGSCTRTPNLKQKGSQSGCTEILLMQWQCAQHGGCRRTAAAQWAAPRSNSCTVGTTEVGYFTCMTQPARQKRFRAE